MFCTLGFVIGFLVRSLFGDRFWLGRPYIIWLMYRKCRELCPGATRKHCFELAVAMERLTRDLPADDYE